MKKVLSILSILALVISVSSCGNKKKKENVGTHTHSDGTVHANDAHDNEAKPNQETFEVKADEDANNEGDHKHDGDDADQNGHNHENGDGHNHNHDGEHTHTDGTVHDDHK